MNLLSLTINGILVESDGIEHSSGLLFDGYFFMRVRIMY